MTPDRGVTPVSYPDPLEPIIPNGVELDDPPAPRPDVIEEFAGTASDLDILHAQSGGLPESTIDSVVDLTQPLDTPDDEPIFGDDDVEGDIEAGGDVTLDAGIPVDELAGFNLKPGSWVVVRDGDVVAVIPPGTGRVLEPGDEVVQWQPVSPTAE